MKYLALLRGINVGGKNKVPMTDLKQCLDKLGYKNVRTYIASGNVIFEAQMPARQAAGQIEKVLPKKFKLDSSLVKVLVISRKELEQAVAKTPPGFGKHPDKYRYDVAFMIDKPAGEAMRQVELNPEVDKAWAGQGTLYYRRLSAKLTKSRMSKLAGKPIYQHMTIRNWNTTTKLLGLMQD